MKTVEEIYQQMRTDFSARTGTVAADSCDLAARMYALAAQIYALRCHSDWVCRQCFPQTAVGENLDHHAAVRGLSRKTGAKAEGTVRFRVETASGLTRTVPAGTVCLTAGLVRYETTETAVLQPGQMWVDVPVRAAEAGTAGNTAANTVTAMAVAPVGIASCTNPEAITGGADPEDDESLRERVLDSFSALPNGANAAFYRAAAMADGEVARAVVVSRPRGVGSVDVVVASHAGVPDEELLDRLQTALDEQREIAVDLQVLAPETVEVDLTVQVKPAAGQDSERVLEGVKTALTGHFTGKLLGRDVLLAELGSVIYGCEGVENYRITTPAADVSMEDTALPVLGSLSVEELT